MRNKQTYLIRASFAFLFFVMLGYLVKFYPQTLSGFDQDIQTFVRGNLPSVLTAFFRMITFIGNTLTQVLIVLVAVLMLYLKKWYIEAGFVAFSGLVTAICISLLKNLYQRPRPSIEHLVQASGYSFPSGHSLGSFLILGSLLVIVHQRLKNKLARQSLEMFIGLLIFLVGLSRIYLGVHYPTDVLGGFILAYGVLNISFPYYDRLRFQWRFQSKQK